MTTAIAAKSGAGLIAGAERIAGSFGETLSRTWSDYRTYRATLAELEGLTTRQLDDAGMRRDDLRRIAFAAVYGR